ncbi:hypothetical protein [Helicobacter pullorum]|uniref:Autotransporter domain-containing protein n=1 Tax=Helicobacter pullorum TaxID=35818 RepID=A0A377PWK7_9HELI|nr:hypothetical protein [Helicobacter pullorum]STQ87246.1 Uncharacterised protein [Helicobacter pullorum]
MDSKSKLESKNPNKIQTAKIQSPKASKDLVNLESSKVLESNLKLDSKTRQKSNKESESKPPKIQRVKNTCDSITIQNPTNSQKSKESSKVKTLIRTIPVSIALASALSSQAVALSTENGQLVNEVIMSGSPTLTVNGTIKNGTIINGTSTIRNNAPTSTNRGNTGGSIINGWDLKYSSWSTPGVIVNNSKNDNAGGVLVTGKFSFAYGDYGHSYEVLAGTKAGNLTFDTGSSFTVPNHGYGNFVNIISVSENASAATIANKGTITQNTNANIINLASSSTTDAIVNSGTITSVGNNLLTLRANATLGILQNSGTMSTTNTNLVDLSGGNNSIKQIELSSGSTTSARTNIINAQSSATIGTITATGATMSGSINLAGTSSITNGISLSNTSTLTGNISLNNSRIQGGIVLDNSKMTGGITLGGSSNIAGISLANASTITGNVTLNGSSSIDNISISGSNASLGGNITMLSNDNTSSIDNITISSGGTYAGTIHTAGRTNISGITIANGGVVGSSNASSMILSSGNSTIHNIDIQNGGTMYGNIEAHWQTGGNANAVDNKDGNIGNVSIAGRLQGDIVLQNKVFMNSLTMSENGTITGSVKVGEGGNDTQTPTLSTITLNGNSGINAIVLGNSNGNGPRATINSLTLEGTSSIGTITNNSNATIVNLTLNETGTITNGITNDSNIGSLDLQNNTTYSGTGSITNALDIANNKTLNANTNGIKILFANNATGTINNAGTILGSIDNQTSSTIKTFNTGSISGSIINNADATIETLNVTSNVGSIANSGDINSLTIQSGSNIANGITNNSNIGSLIVNENVSYSGSGSISNALEVAEGDTLTIGGNGTLNFDSDNGTINNAGTINGDINNNGTLTDFTNSGSISGTFTNEGHIVKFVNTDTGSINTFTNNNTISFFENNGTITNFDGDGIIYGVINSKTITNGFENVATSLWNKENALITGNVALKGDYKDCTDSGGTICKTSDLINDGTITGNVTNDTGKEINSVRNTGSIGGSIANSGSINTLEVSGTIAQGILNDTDASISSITINEGANLGNSGITNNSNIGTFIVNESVKYTGNGSDRITQALIVAKDKTLTIGSNGTLSFNSAKGSVNNAGTIAGNLSNVKDSIITSFNNSGTITGNLYNDGHIDTLSNTGTMGTIYNTSKETIVALGNDKGATIEAVNNTGNINIITNDGTINGQITSQNNSEIKEILIGENGIVNAKGTLDSSNMQDTSNDAVSLDTINTTLIHNQGTIQGNVRVVGQGSVIGEITNQDTISGCILVDGGRIGNINNTNGAIANCMSFSNGASVDNLNNSGTIKDKITNNSGNITVNNSGSIGGITTSNGGNTTIINGGMDKPGGNIGAITNTGSNSNTHIDGWTLDNPDNPSNPIIIADGSDKDGIHLKEDSIFVEGNLESGKIYNYYDYIQNEDKESIGQEFSQDDELFNALTFIPIFNPTDNGDGTFSVGLDTKELSGKTLGASLIYSSRMRQIDTNNMLKEINVKNFKTDFEILEQRERLKNQQALLENYKQQRESYLNELTKDNKELKRVSSKESTSLSTYANNSNIKSDAIEVVDYYNKDTLASLDNLQATTKANQETYSNLDLLRELDDIFISHTGDKDNLYTFALPYTRYTSAQLDGGVGTLKSHASGILAGAQAKLPSERGILGIYFGYESSDKQVGQQRLDFDEKVYYGGLTYYNVFARKGVSEYYLSANTRIDKGDTNLYKTYRSGSTTIDSQVDSYGYGADLKVGANYYNIYNNSVLSPEIGISYQGISTDTFRLRHLGGVSEHYYAQDVNFFDISASLRWQRAWNNVFKTMASLGAMYNVYNDAKGSGVIAGLKQSADINVEELYGTTQVGISYALGENANIALNYSGIFANGVQSHAGYIRLGVWW